MKISKLVQQHIKQIFDHCEKVDPDEIHRLLDRNYSKTTFERVHEDVNQEPFLGLLEKAPLSRSRSRIR